MASILESDYRNPPHFLHQGPGYREAPYTPPPYYLLPSSTCNSAVALAPYFSPNPLFNSIQHVHNEYDYFVNGVISDVLLRVDDGFAYKPRYDEKLASPCHYAAPQADLMWGSDVSFGPNGYHPSSPTEAQVESEPAFLYGIRPLSHPPPTPTPKLESDPEPEPEPETIPLEQQEDQLPELAELNRGGLQKITGKKRRRLLHIIAERNRRLHQNKMYEELYRMVPGLEKSSRSTKREVLMRTADFLEDIIEGNKKLERQLRQLPRPGHGRG